VKKDVKSRVVPRNGCDNNNGNPGEFVCPHPRAHHQIVIIKIFAI